VTPKQTLFVEHYIANGFNGEQAAIKAGYSAKTARSTAHENLTKPYIAAAVEKAVRAKLRNIDRLSVKWLDEVCRLAFSDIRQVATFDEHGVAFKADSELTDDAARAIETVESTVTKPKTGEVIVNRKIRLHSKASALAMLGKYLGTQTDNPPPQSPAEALDAEARRERIAYLQSKLGGKA
jgi:phage terminase small subunit